MTGRSQNLVNDFVIKLKKGKVGGSQATARLTAELLRVVISQQKVPQTNQAEALIETVRSVGVQLITANPSEPVVRNIVRRVLHIIREEELSMVANAVGGLRLSASGDLNDVVEQENGVLPSAAAAAAKSLLHPPSLHSLLDHTHDLTVAHGPSAMVDSSEAKATIRSTKSWRLKREVMEAVKDLIEDITTSHEQIAEQAVEQIHHNEVILTLGHSTTVIEFLCVAKGKKRSVQVFIAEGAPMYQGHILAMTLAAKGFQTTVIADSAVFAIISRVNMVIVGVHAVMVNGGVMGNVGLRMVALAAKRHAVPLIVLAGTHKLCPLYPENPEVVLNEMKSPSELLTFGEFTDLMDYRIGNGTPRLHVVNPAYDYVPPEEVKLFITEVGGYSPSFMYRLIADYYSADDLVLQKQTAVPKCEFSGLNS